MPLAAGCWLWVLPGCSWLLPGCSWAALAAPWLLLGCSLAAPWLLLAAPGCARLLLAAPTVLPSVCQYVCLYVHFVPDLPSYQRCPLCSRFTKLSKMAALFQIYQVIKDARFVPDLPSYQRCPHCWWLLSGMSGCFWLLLAGPGPECSKVLLAAPSFLYAMPL